MCMYMYTAVSTEPLAKKPRIARRTEFLASESEEEEEEDGNKLESVRDSTKMSPDVVEREKGEREGRNPRKLALDSSSESDNNSSESESESDGEDGNNTNADDHQMCTDGVDSDQRITTDIQSPVMNTVDLVIDQESGFNHATDTVDADFETHDTTSANAD